MPPRDLSMGDVRRQLLTHLREKGALAATLLRNANPRPCTVQHCLESNDSLGPYTYTAPLRLVFTDNAGGHQPYTWDELYQHGYVRATPLHMLVFHNFEFKPKVFSTVPSLGNRDASPVEICNALRALGGRSTPVIATVTESDDMERRHRLQLRAQWSDEDEDKDGDGAADSPPPASLELSSAPLQFSRNLELRHLFVGINTGSMIAHDLVRHIAGARKTEIQ